MSKDIEQLIWRIDRRVLREALISLPPAQITCPECGTLRGPDEILFIRDLGWCRACAEVPAYIRKYQIRPQSAEREEN